NSRTVSPAERFVGFPRRTGPLADVISCTTIVFPVSFLIVTQFASAEPAEPTVAARAAASARNRLRSEASIGSWSLVSVSGTDCGGTGVIQFHRLSEKRQLLRDLRDHFSATEGITPRFAVPTCRGRGPIARTP